MTPIADMVERMFAEGVALHVVILAIRTAESVTHASRDASRSVMAPSRSKAAVRAARYREKLKQNQPKAEANDAAIDGARHRDGERDASRDDAGKRCDLSSFLSSPSKVLTEEGSQKSKKARSENARARGTRIKRNAVLSDADRAAAIDLGAEPSKVDGMWAEFIDYWIGVPGQRGTKLDWSATWRNRVRMIATKGKRNGNGTSPVASAFDDLIARAESIEGAGDRDSGAPVIDHRAQGR